jgi:outer membrane protein assembly factor BamB
MTSSPRVLRPALTLCLLLLTATLAPAGNWPRFRGPNGTGVAEDKDVPVKFSGFLWKTALPGKGHSSPVVWGERLFVQSAHGKERLLLCLDAVKGDVLWSKAVAGRGGRTHVKNTVASSTPATDGEKVYAVFWDGKEVRLYAYDFKGNPAWQYHLGNYEQSREKNRHGAAPSPVVHGGKVFVNFDVTGTAKVIAVDAKTGKRAWEAPRRAFRTCYSTPFLLEQDGGHAQLVVTSTAGITAYDPSSGEKVWDYTWGFSGMALRTVGSSVAGDGLVFACSGDGSGARAMIAVKAGGKGDVTRTNLAWEKDSGTPYVPTVLARGGYLYLVDDKGSAICFEAKTGKEMWRHRLGGTVSSSPVLVGDKVYSVDERGDVYVFEASPKGFKRLGKSGVGETVYATPAVANGRLYIRGARHLFCVGKKVTR